MKFNFFTKKGRPTSIEKEVCVKITNLIKDKVITESQIEEYVSQNGMSTNFEELDTLHDYLTGKVPFDDYSNSSTYNDSNNTQKIEQEYKKEFKNEEKMSENGFDPFEEPVIERSYTKGIVDDIDESLYDDANVIEDFDAEGGNDDFQNYEEDDIPQAEFNINPEEDYDDSDLIDGESGSSKLAEGNLKDLSTAQKRKSAEKTADAVLGLYCNFVPAPFKHLASFKERKINELSLKKEIDLEMELDGDMTIKEYIDNTNKQVEAIFEVSEEQKNEIREPLIDVLLEQELALTPTQRLLLAVGGHLVTMSVTAYNLAQNNKMALETFKTFQSDKVMSSQPFQPTQPKPQYQPYQQPQPQSQPKPQSFTPTSSGNNFDEMTAFDTKMASEIIDIMDSKHDPNVTIESTMED